MRYQHARWHLLPLEGEHIMGTGHPQQQHVNPCYASSPLDGVADRCTRDMHFTGDHVGTLHSWPDVELDPQFATELMWEQYRPFTGSLPRAGLATSDVLVAPPNAKNVTPKAVTR